MRAARDGVEATAVGWGGRPSVERVLGLSDPVTSILLFAACVVGALGVVLALPRRGLSPQIVGTLVAALGLGLLFIWLSRFLKPGDGLPNPNFYLFALIALGSALRVISHPRPVYAALYFILTILASCGLYVLLSAEFMAFALVIVYAGAILITYLFVIMLATESPTADQVESLRPYDRYSKEPVVATVFAFALVAALSVLLVRGTGELPPTTQYAAAERIIDLPRKVEIALREAEVIGADERIAVGTVGAVGGGVGEAGSKGATRGRPLIEVDTTTGLVTAVTVVYGEGIQKRVDNSNPKWPEGLRLTNVEGVGFALLADHPGAIEVAGVILLMAMLGAVVLARKKVELDEREKLAAQQRSLGEEFTPEHSPLMAPRTPDAPAATADLVGGRS